jgi:hypothetical protein
MSDVQVTYGQAPTAAVETPSESLVKDANRIVIVTDTRGRQLGVKSARNALNNFRLSRILGADAGNRNVMSQAAMYCAVVSINGDPVPFPKTELQLEALIDRLGVGAFNLVVKTQLEEFTVGLMPEDEAQEAKN